MSYAPRADVQLLREPVFTAAKTLFARSFHRDLDHHVSKSIGSLASVTSELHETLVDLSDRLRPE